MLAVLENSRTGKVTTCDVPAPELRPGMVLVRSAFSAISSGTERAKLELGSKSLVGKAMSRPELVKQVLDVARAEGVATAYNKVKARLETLNGVGYSCAGTVLDVGAGVNEFRPGAQSPALERVTPTIAKSILSHATSWCASLRLCRSTPHR